MPEQDNLEAVRLFFERVLNAGDYESLRALSHPDVAIPQYSPGVEAFRRHLSELRDTFASPDYKLMDAVCEGEKVAVRFSVRARHAGKFMGVPATGRPLNLWGVMMFRFEAGSIAEFWSLVDAQGVLTQLRGA